jgi:hypothetical protein
MRFKISACPVITISMILAPLAAFADSHAAKCAQGELAELGFYAGEIDGKIGPVAKAAGAKYIDFMQERNPGWNQPDLSRSTSELWCKQLAAAFPDKLRKYLMEFNGPGTSLLEILGVSVKGPTNTKEPYPTMVEFRTFGNTPIVLDEVCYTWNFNSELCLPLGELNVPVSDEVNNITTELTTGAAGTWVIVAYFKYTSQGIALKSAESATTISVVEE